MGDIKQSFDLICRTGAYCNICRLKVAAGQKWREAKAERFTMPDGGNDFECPYGKPWLGETTKQMATLTIKGEIPKTEPQKKTSCGGCSRAKKKADGKPPA